MRKMTKCFIDKFIIPRTSSLGCHFKFDGLPIFSDNLTAPEIFNKEVLHASINLVWNHFIEKVISSLVYMLSTGSPKLLLEEKNKK